MGRCGTIHLLLVLGTFVLPLSLGSNDDTFTDTYNGGQDSKLTYSTAKNHEMGTTERNGSATGHWFNKYTPFNKCWRQSEPDDCKEVLRNQPPLGKDHAWRPHYRLLIRRISCTLQKINCPVNGLSFQLHDVPCQSACMNVLTQCGLRNHGFNDGPNPHVSDQVEFIPSCPDNTFIQPDTDAWEVSPRSYLWDRNPRVMQQVRSHARYLDDHPSRYARLQDQTPHSKNFHPYWYNTFRHERLYRHSRSHHHNPTEMWIVPTRNEKTIRPNQSAPRTVNKNKTPSYSSSKEDSVTMQQFQLSDCLLLPAGGCDKMTSYFADATNALSSQKVPSVQANSDCPSDLTEMCQSMFPREYTRQQWINGEFTVAAVIRVSQTLWWFGENNRYQPFFRFHMLETLESDIHPYDDKMILTYSWPSRCVCPNEITVDKRYLMLTHSYKARQTLNITSKTVFLTRIRRYTKRLACWKGACPRRQIRNRRRRYPAVQWRWNEE